MHSRSTYNTGLSTRSTSSRHSDDSQDSQSTAPTSLHSGPSIYQTHGDPPAYSESYDFYVPTTSDPRYSTSTYVSGVSEEEFCEEPESYDPEYEVPQYRAETETELRPSTPSDFANFFPSSKRLYIRHDDTAQDGNMNLRVDVDDSSSHQKSNVQLFYLRMHDLKKREFSLRRYERSSGREVCHSNRKYAKSGSEKKTHAITSSVSHAFASMRGNRPEFKRTNSGLSMRSGSSTQRQDSGYGSDLDDDQSLESFMAEKKSVVEKPTNTIKLEFSNYAQVEVKRSGNKSSKRYEFEYWGHSYSWKRITEKDGPGKAVSYHLFKGDSSSAVAHIVPELRSPVQVYTEEAAGGWVPPCSMWISDPTVLEALTDVADVIVATGLIALVDDSIKRHFNNKPKSKSIQVGVPLTQLKLDMDLIGPRAMVEHMFKRRNSGGSTKEHEQRRSPLRQESMTAY